jgi:hypothetical protein
MSWLEKKSQPVRRCLHYAMGIFAVLVLIVLSTYLVVIERARYAMTALSCERLAPQEFQEAITPNLKRLYVKPTDATSTVTFHFDVPSASPEKFVLVISSRKIKRDVYHGKFETKIALTVSADLTNSKSSKRGSYDDLSLRFYDRKTNIACGAGHEADFWQPNKNVFIALLPHRELDELGLPVAFKVRVE